MKVLNATIDLQALTLQLLRQDLKTYRLRQGLYDIGFEGGTYYTDIPKFVYELMGIPKERHEEADKLYNELLHAFPTHNLGDEVFLDAASATMFTHLGERFTVGLKL